MQVADDSNDVEMPDIPQEVEFRERTKRSAETTVEDLEEEIRQDRIEMLSEFLLYSDLGLCWVEDASPVLNIIEMSECCVTPISCPDMFDFSVSSIRFESHDRHESVQVTLGGGNVLIWKPDEAIDDSTLALVDCDNCVLMACVKRFAILRCAEPALCWILLRAKSLIHAVILARRDPWPF